MKPVLSVVWQTIVLYLAAFAGFVVGMTVPSLRFFRVISQSASLVRTYDFDWLIAVFLMYALLLGASALRGRLKANWPATTIALAVTLAAVVLFTRLGIKETAL